ncbi:2-succinyl-5-enolpyruvyl-6-hydroxy-3-cyclohexene-1-carboxylate synthase [Myceligenerans pegani]|uniref:2-succinyl-5-enolpyruvyl-6-hydroxy-3-cyclohexene-1-carboxylate synthase n=1 Tax=Myceligenerans pegani TaxID=2776917 RepID=A0ABR9N4K2_9MICO|nr:thiamine pyrophosphate-binding protein [Myceligenerans sp. TRM 65318]MBE1878613.1 2-succinyl-5-enolpyruvyl-6-hydroxy-3-cyclohexene-1-carboxylate synthase [Myceligenerans sp. TRM 65318]MBE3020884.1 2-succinyl-5-enolpyruvyl-6-hydroxy-3-cyclohexene-1-carboxylate synthase [Myceligenerans sp. TRM 65318]
MPDNPASVCAARGLISELVAHGVRDVVLAPGSRSAPLAYAAAEAAEAGRLTLHVRIDERTAGFLALGLSRGSALTRDGDPAADRGHEEPDRGSPDQAGAPTGFLTPLVGHPVAVITTSGTAVANLHPAVLEAHHTGVPLILLTADRPHELRGTGASQTTHQPGIFAGAVRYEADVPAPSGTDLATRATETRDLAALAARAASAALGLRDGTPGPVHLNLSYRDPLHPAAPPPDPELAATTPAPDAAVSTTAPRAEAEPRHPAAPDGSGGAAEPGSDPVAPEPGRPSAGLRQDPGVSRPVTVVVPGTVRHLASPALPGHPGRTVVVAGDGAGPAARRLAEAQGWPLLAEPSSGACGGANAIPAYRLVLGEDGLAGEIQQAVVLGRPTLSRPVQRMLSRPDVVVTVVAPGGLPWPDAARNAAQVVPGLAPEWYEPRDEADGDWLRRWQAAGRAAATVIDEVTRDDAVADGPTALSVARAVATVLGDDDVLVVGSSNPVRDLDLVLGTDDLGSVPAVIANRGLAGIDGSVSTATGVALAAARAGRRTRALLGDLTLLHDVGGLLRGPGEPAVDLEIVVVNDDGGSIFATLEHGELAATSDAAGARFERVFGTPHGANLAQLCAGYGVDHQLVKDVPSLRHALQAPSRGVQVIEVQVPRAARHAEARDLAHRVADVVRGVV